MSFSQTFRKVATAASEIAKAAGGVTQPQPTVAMPSASNVSARQRLLYQPTQADKWYSGDAPTSSDIMARIFTIGKTNPEESKQLFATYQTMQADPSSPIYNPYTKSTNKAVDELAALGADVSRGIDDKWLASYDWLKNHYRMETGNTPLAPSSKSSTEENAAYWYYRVLQAEPATKKAEQEWEALQEEISYWAGRADRNYSDDEVLAKIDWSSYPTLVGMDEDAAKGLPTVLNRPVGYSQDALRGVVWAARNGGDKADPYNSVRAALGQGNTWKENADISAMLDPTNERYNPYAVGSTLDDAALYFGVSSFDQKWLDDNRGVLSGTDETAKRYYKKVYDAEQTTQKAEAELADLREYVDAYLQNNGDPSTLLEYLLDDYPTLQAMQTSLESGDLKATTRAINFSPADITAEVNQRVAEKNAEKASADTKMQGVMGVIDRTYSAMTGNTQAVESGKTAAATMAASTIMEQGTPEEQIVFRTAYSADFMTRCQELNAAIETGAPNLEGEYDYSLQLANDYTSQHYFGILEGMRPYEAVQEEITKIEQEIDAKERLLYNIPDVAPGTGGTPWKMQQVDGVWYQFGAELDPATREWKLTGVWNEDSPDGEVSDAAKAAAQTWISGLPLEPLSEEEAYTNEQELSVLKQKLQVARNELKAAEPAYSKAAEQNEAMTQAYDTLARLRELTGVEAGNVTGYRALMEDIYTVGAEYKPTEWLPYNPFENLLSYPEMSVESVSKIAEESLKSYGTEITRLQKMLDTAKEFGLDVPDEYIKNIDREIARLGRLSKDAEYFLLAQNPDVHTVAEDVRSKVWKDVHENGKGWGIMPDEGSSEPSEYNGYYHLDYEVMFDALYWSSSTYAYHLTDEERDLYLYIRETQGYDAAYEYYYHLTNDTYGIMHVRESASAEEIAQSVREQPVLTNLEMIVSSPFRALGTLYSLVATLKGEEINPYHPAFIFVTAANITKEQSKQMINEELGEGTDAAWWANLGYDAVVAAGESLVNMAATGGTGALAEKGATVAAKFGFKVLAGISTAAPMGLQAAASAIQDAKYRGADDAQAWALAGATFVAETFTEAITVSNLRAARGLASGDEVKAFIKTLIPSMLEEGFGESMSEAITSLSDDWIMGELSNRNAIIQAAINEGMTLEEAEDFATKKILNDILYAGATGMMSSAATTTAGHVAGKLNPDDTKAGLPKAEVADMETDQATETEDGMPLMQESFGPEEQKKEADQKAKNELSKSVTALTAAATADEASQTATISAVLTADNASHGVEATAAAAAQHMVADMGGARATVKLSSILLTAAENGMSREAVKVAVSTAALTNGPAHEALMENRRAATPEYVNNLIALAGQEMAQPEAVKQIRQAVNDNRVAMKVSEAASEGAFAEVVPFEDAVNQAKANRRVARAALEREQKTAQTMGQNLQSLNAEFIEDPTNQMVRGSVQQAIKDVEGQAKVVQEYEQGLTNAEESLQKAERDLTTKRRSLLTNLRMQAQAAVNEEQQGEQESELQNAPIIAENVQLPWLDTQETEETTQESTEEPAQQLKSWQDPQYHGKVKNPRKLKTNTKNFEKWFSDPSGDLSNPDGTPKIIYRGTGSKLYMEHKAKSKQKSGSYLNFYSPDIPIATSYANGSNHVFKVYDIVNWETAAAAMKAEGYELREERNEQGEWGYRAYGVSPESEYAAGDFYKEDELDRFNKEYGQIRRYGLYAGFVSLKNPLVIDANGSVYDDVEATVKDENGNDYHGVKSNREWAEWARDQGYDGVIVRNVKDYLYENDHYADPGTVIMTFDSQKFKSIYNTGKLGKKNADIRYSKAGTFALTGEAISDQMKAVLDTLATGKAVSVEDVMSVPEVMWAEEHQLPGESMPWRKEGYTEDDVAELLPEDRVLLHAEIEDTLMDQGSAVIDENGKVEYTGPVKQEKRVDIVIGPPGAGKSSALANPLSQAYSSRIIDSDAVKELLPEYEGGLNSGYLNTESRYVWKGIVETSIANGDNIVLPVVGRSLSSVMKDMSAFRKNGYSVNVHYLELDGNKVLGRALNRFLSEGRYITPEYLMLASDGGITDVYESLKGEDIDGYSHWNNDVPRGQIPQLLEASDPDILADLDGRTADQRGTVDAGNRKGPPSESGTGGQGSKTAAPVIQASKVSTQPQPSASSMPSGGVKNLKSPQRIAKALAQNLHIGDYIGTRKMNGLPHEVRGYYQTKANYIGVRNTEAGNYTVTMHEIGHALAALTGMTGTADMVAALDPVFAASYSPAELPGEAFAEFFWRYAADENAARAFAGDAFVDEFQHKLRQKRVSRDVQRAADQLRAWIAASADDKIGSTIRSHAAAPKMPFREQFRQVIDGIVDGTAAAEAVNKKIRQESGGKQIDFNMDIRANALMNNYANGQANFFWTTELRDSHGNVINKGLTKVLADAGLTAKDEPTFERYLLATHSMNRDEQGKAVFDDHITKSEREKFIKKVENTQPHIKEAAEALHQWWQDFMQAWMVDTGRMEQNVFDMLNKIYPYYVPTRRVKDPRYVDQNRTGGRNYQIRQATGSTEDIWSPLETMADMVQSIVSMVITNKAALAWDTAYQTYDLGEFGRDITPDMRRTAVDTTELQEAVADMLEKEVDEDVLQNVIDLIGAEQVRWASTGNSSLANTLVVQRPDGSRKLYEIRDTELLKLLAGINESYLGRGGVFAPIGKLTRTMTMLATGSNPLFPSTNVPRDFFSSLNYGSWATNPLTGIVKWGITFANVLMNTPIIQEYRSMGGGGWQAVNAGTKKGATQLRNEMFKGREFSSPSRAAKKIGKMAWSTITMEKLNEALEMTSKAVEYMYGKHDRSTEEGRARAFLASQDVTTDFARSGNAKLAGQIKAVVPFFNSSLQGIYRNARMFSEAERDRLPARLVKTVINTTLMSLLANGLLLKNLSDDEKEDYAYLSDDLKAKNLFIPNFAKNVLGHEPVLNIALPQDPLVYAINSLVTNAVWSGTQDEAMVEFGELANTILDSLNPVSSGTIFRPFIDAAQNLTWFDSKIINGFLSDLKDPTLQYSEDTPEIFRVMGRWFGMSPLKVQYLAQQYTGFLGQIAIPVLSKDEKTGEIGGSAAVVDVVRKKLTADPLVSNDIVNSFYDGRDFLDSVVQSVSNGKPLNKLRRGLTPEEATEAYEEAKAMLAKDGIIGSTKTALNDLYKELDEIYANPDYSDEKKHQEANEVRRTMIALALDAQEAIGEYKEKYVTGDNLVMRMLTEGTTIQAPTAYDRMEQTFKDDEQQPYMQRASEVYKATGNDSALPHPNTGFSVKDKITKEDAEYVVEPEYWGTWVLDYKSAYVEYLAKNGRGWEMMTDAQKLDVLKKAHSAGHEAAKKRYAKIHGIKLND